MKYFPGLLASLLQPLAAWGLARVWGGGQIQAGSPEFAAFPRTRSGSRSRWRLELRDAQPLGLTLGEASPGFGPVRLKLVSHERRRSGNPGSGRGRARREGARPATYMRRGPADGCQEFPMKGDGGKFGQLGLANGEPREGSAPFPRPRPPRLPQL